MKPIQIFFSLVVVIAAVVVVVFSMSQQTTPIADVPKVEKGEPVLTDDGEIDYYPENPFDFESDGEKPVAVLEEPLFDFGKMMLGDTQNHDFIIKNDGSVPLKLAKGRSMCKCTVSGMQVDEIAPGKSATVNLEWTPKSTGEFSQGAVIWTNDPDNPSLAISVRGNMFKKVIQEPSSSWILGNISRDEPTPFKGALFSPIVEEFNITNIETSSDLIEVQYEPIDDEDKEYLGATSGFNLTGKVRSDGKAGKFKGTVTVHTDLEGDNTFTYQIDGTKAGPLQVIGPGWYAGQQLLDLGTIDSGKGKTHRITWMIVPGEEPLTMKQLSANPSFVNVTLKAEDSSKLKNRERYTLTIEVPPDAPDGNWPLDKPGQVLLETNHPEIGTYELGISLKIRKP